MFKVGIIGAGHIAVKMAATLNGMQGVEAYAIASRDYDRAKKFAEDNHCTHAYGSYAELVNDPQVDLVYVATPHSFHHEHVRLCLEHGKPVLCEKAFMANAREAEDVIRLSEERGIFLGEAIWTRFLPFQKSMSEVVRSGIIGRPTILSAHLCYPVAWKDRIMKPELGGGALLDLGVYAVNFAMMFFGTDIEDVTSSCVKSDTGVDLQESITFRYRDGRMACLMASALCANDRQGIVNGPDGYIICDNINNMLRADRYDINHNLVETYRAPEQITGFEYQVQASIDAIAAGRVETQQMPHSESLRVMRLFDSLRASWDVRFPNDD